MIGICLMTTNPILITEQEDERMAKLKLNVVEKMMSDMCDKMTAQQALIDELVEGLRYAFRMCRGLEDDVDMQYLADIITKAERNTKATKG